MRREIIFLASKAGFFAALASILGKLAFDALVIESFLLQLFGEVFVGLGEEFQKALLYLLRGIALAGMLLCNAAMTNTTAKTMDKSPTTATVTVSITGFNFLFTGIGGFLLGENLSLSWAFGSILVTSGILCIASEEVKNEKRQ